jgi:hypothetical protein
MSPSAVPSTGKTFGTANREQERANLARGGRSGARAAGDFRQVKYWSEPLEAGGARSSPGFACRTARDISGNPSACL